MGKSLRGMAITAASGGGRALSGTMIVLAIGLLCSLECTVLAVDDGAGLHTADAPAPAEDNLLKLSESAEDQEQLSSEKLENDPIPAPRADIADPLADPYTYKELNGFVIKETAVTLAGDPKDPLLSYLLCVRNRATATIYAGASALRHLQTLRVRFKPSATSLTWVLSTIGVGTFMCGVSRLMLRVKRYPPQSSTISLE